MPYIDGTENGSNGNDPAATLSGIKEEINETRKLVLCFDGTGNSFSGSNADTNVVKILQKMDRNAPDQHHYYQTGIGTYEINETSVNKTWWGELKSTLSQTLDQGLGTTFDAHVMAGYRFLMRYYTAGDKIYMFGFSRGAFTARFLARMINKVGLLCMGNEEMVPFAFRLYQRYLEGEIEDFHSANTFQDEHNADNTDQEASYNAGQDQEDEQGDRKTPNHGRRYRRALNEIRAFSNTFCRQEDTYHCGKHERSNVKVYFLGIWDCVSSVAVLEQNAPKPMPVTGTAHHVRHAVAVDERRVKFKAALLAQDICQKTEYGHQGHEDMKEVWFPGGHGDVGGGWPTSDDHSVKNFWTTRKAKDASSDMATDRFQMSDIPLAWMIREVEMVGRKDPAAAIRWSPHLRGFKKGFQRHKNQALRGCMHDCLSFGRGSGFFTVMMWKVMEWLPIIKRWELEGNQWNNKRFPLNRGGTRDIPRDAVLHESLIWRLKNDTSYCPGNNHGDYLDPCLKHRNRVAEFTYFEDKPGLAGLEQDGAGVMSVEEEDEDEVHHRHIHRTYTFVYTNEMEL